MKTWLRRIFRGTIAFLSVWLILLGVVGFAGVAFSILDPAGAELAKAEDHFPSRPAGAKEIAVSAAMNLTFVVFGCWLFWRVHLWQKAEAQPAVPADGPASRGRG